MYSKKYPRVSSCSSADRFIPQRRGSNLEASNYLLNKTSLPSSEVQVIGNSRYVNYAYLNWNKKIYQERLWSMVASTPQRVLNFSETSHSKSSSGNVNCPLWPVKGRKKPLIGPPSMVLDMPNLEANVCHHVADWSKKGCLASVFEHEIYLWHPDTNVPSIVTNTGGKVEQCVCWNRSATNFAIAMENSRVAVWDCIKNQIANQAVCPCGTSACTITSLGWTSSNQLLAGCSLGRLCIWSPTLTLVNMISRAHYGTIITIALSCDERYLATTATDGPVRTWLWPGLRPLFEIDYRSPVRGVAWHPWQDSLFAVGGNVGEGSLTLWSASNSIQIGFKPPPNECCFIDNLTFSSLTGELVVSYCQQQENSMRGSGKSSIVILSNLEKRVDAIEWHSDRVLYLLWGGDGTKLGTAGADENFCVWDFLGTSSDIIKSYKKANKKQKFSINPIDNLNLFGQCIR